VQERFETTPLGRIAISVFLLVTFAALLTANLPESRLQELLLKADHRLRCAAVRHAVATPDEVSLNNR